MPRIRIFFHLVKKNTDSRRFKNENYETIKNIFPQDLAQIVGLNNEASVDQMREAINGFIDEGLNSGNKQDIKD